MYPQVMLFHLQALEAKTEKSLQNSVVLNIDGTQNSSQYRLTATINFSELHSVLISASEKSLKKETQHWQVGEKLIINLNSLSGKLLISNSLCSFPGVLSCCFIWKLFFVSSFCLILLYIGHFIYASWSWECGLIYKVSFGAQSMTLPGQKAGHSEVSPCVGCMHPPDGMRLKVLWVAGWEAQLCPCWREGLAPWYLFGRVAVLTEQPTS